MTTDEVKNKIKDEDDFIYVKRFDYSLSKLLERYPEGCPDRVIAQALMVTEGDVEAMYNSIVEKLRHNIGACR